MWSSIERSSGQNTHKTLPRFSYWATGFMLLLSLWFSTASVYAQQRDWIKQTNGANVGASVVKEAANPASVGTLVGACGGYEVYEQNGVYSTPQIQTDLLITLGDPPSVLRYSYATGEFLGDFVAPGSGGIDLPQRLTYGPDGNLYVASFGSRSVLRYSGVTGNFIDVFIPPGSGGLGGPYSVIFGPDGNLYVTSSFYAASPGVLRYNGKTGAFIDVFVSGTFNTPFFGSDGNLYITSSLGVLRYDGKTGLPYPAPGQSGAFFAAGDEGALTIGPNGDLFVTSQGRTVLRYNGKTGAFIGTFVANVPLPFDQTISDMAFGPDGNLYITGYYSTVYRYDGKTGAFVNSFGSGLRGTLGLTFTRPAGWNGTLKVGDNRNNTLTGTDGPDLILGLGGNDDIDGRGSDDVVCGGDGNDALLGNDGNDFLDGGAGNDDLNGGNGDYDQLVGGEGNDALLDGDGVSQAAAGSGNDDLRIVLRNGWRNATSEAHFTGLTAGYGNDKASLTILDSTPFLLNLSGDEDDNPTSAKEGKNDRLELMANSDPASTIIKFERIDTMQGKHTAAGAAYLTDPVDEEVVPEQMNRLFLPFVVR